MADPRLVDPSQGDYHLRPGSPALGTGQDGRDMGAMVPAGVTISGLPPVLTPHANATLTVSGPGITHYKYRLDEGSWSGEHSVDTPIRLTGLSNGTHQVLVIARNVAGMWQAEADAFRSASWTVDPLLARVRIHEVLARNDDAVQHHGTYPDFIELYNDGTRGVDLSGMSVSDDRAEPGKFVFPAGTFLGPEQFLVLVADDRSDLPGMHVGFALRGEGEGLFLFESPGRGGALLDWVEFGPQVSGLSIGRVGHDGRWQLTRPTLGGKNVAQPTGDPSTLKINEWLASNDVQRTDNFVELYNPDPLPVDLSGLYLSDDPVARPDRQQIPPLSFVAGTGYVTFIAEGDAGAGGDQLNFRLASDQELLGLFGRELEPIDTVIYYWQTTDVSQGRIPDGGHRFAYQPVATPGAANEVPTAARIDLVALDDQWAYDDRGLDLGRQWLEPAYDDQLWAHGAAVLAAEEDVLPAAINTDLALGAVTYYFRKTFALGIDPAAVTLELTTLIDDGAIVYINGAEVLRLGLPAGDVAYDRRANRGVGNAQLEGPFSIPGDVLVQGENTIAVEVHQISPTNNDVAFSLALDAHVSSTNQRLANAVALLDGLRITEIMYNAPGGAEFEFIELQNVGDRVLDLTGVRLEGGIDYTFPSVTLEPGQFAVVVADADGFRSRYGDRARLLGEFSGRLANEGESLVLRLPSPYDGMILRFEYDDDWYRDTDGSGHSLVIRNPWNKPATWDEASRWRSSVVVGGSPGFLVGDVNVDGRFDTNDIVGLLQAGKYLTGQPATWHEGDFSGDGLFDPADLVLVLQAENYLRIV